MTAHQNHTNEPAASTDMVPRVIDGWPLFHGIGEPGWWVKDLDLAEHAEMKQPRDIRPIIRKALGDGSLTIVAEHGSAEQIQQAQIDAASARVLCKASVEAYGVAAPVHNLAAYRKRKARRAKAAAKRRAGGAS